MSYIISRRVGEVFSVKKDENLSLVSLAGVFPGVYNEEFGKYVLIQVKEGNDIYPEIIKVNNPPKKILRNLSDLEAKVDRVSFNGQGRVSFVITAPDSYKIMRMK